MSFVSASATLSFTRSHASSLSTVIRENGGSSPSMLVVDSSAADGRVVVVEMLAWRKRVSVALAFGCLWNHSNQARQVGEMALNARGGRQRAEDATCILDVDSSSDGTPRGRG